MDVCRVCCVLSGTGLCNELITCPEDSYQLWCIVVCDLETSWRRRPWPTGGYCAKIKKIQDFYSWLEEYVVDLFSVSNDIPPLTLKHTNHVRSKGAKASGQESVLCVMCEFALSRIDQDLKDDATEVSKFFKFCTLENILCSSDRWMIRCSIQLGLKKLLFLPYSPE